MYIIKHRNGGTSKMKIYIHTDNVVGRENMYQTLLGAQRRGKT